MGTKQLLAYPLIDELEYRGNIDPKQLNRMFSSIKESVLRSIIKSTQTQTYLEQLLLGIESSYQSYFRAFNISNHYPVGNSIFCSAYGNSFGGRKDDLTGCITLDWDTNRNFSKIPKVDDVLSPDVVLTLDSVVKDQDEDIYNIFKDNKVWIENVSDEEHILQIDLPPTLNKKFNYIKLIPFPIFGVKINKIEYLDLQSQAITLDIPVYYNEMGPLVLHSTPRDFNNTIKIYMSPINGINALGFSSIEIGYIDYNNNNTDVYLEFENIPKFDGTASISTIKPQNISLDYFIDKIGLNDSSFINSISIVNSITNPTVEINVPIRTDYIQLDGSSVDVTSGLFLKFNIKEVNMTTPMIRGAKLDYTL